MKSLTAFFSATGRTGKMAEGLAKATGSDIYEIKPVVKYTKSDLNWMNKKSRSTFEMNNRSLRPEIIKGDIDVSGYDTVFLCFPIWWYVAPTVINAFLESYDFAGKRIILFATSGSSKFGNTLAELKPSAPDSVFVEGKVISGLITESKIAGLAEII